MITVVSVPRTRQLLEPGGDAAGEPGHGGDHLGVRPPVPRRRGRGHHRHQPPPPLILRLAPRRRARRQAEPRLPPPAALWSGMGKYFCDISNIFYISNLRSRLAWWVRRMTTPTTTCTTATAWPRTPTVTSAAARLGSLSMTTSRTRTWWRPTPAPSSPYALPVSKMEGPYILYQQKNICYIKYL